MVGSRPTLRRGGRAGKERPLRGGIASRWWLLGMPRIRSVHAHPTTQEHGVRTRGDDEALTIGSFGSNGQVHADMLMGNALPTYSESGYGHSVEKPGSTQGWTWPVFEEHWHYGLPQEMRHFVRCVRGEETPIADGETGRVVQEALYGAYASHGLGRKVHLPFRPTGIAKPIVFWKHPAQAERALGGG